MKRMCVDQCHPTYHWGPQIIQENQPRRQWGDWTVLNRKGSLGPWHLLQSQQTLNLNRHKADIVNWCQSVSSFWHHMRCVVGKTRDFPDLKNKHKPIAISEATDDWHMWKESRNRRSSEIQGTALGKSLQAWACIYWSHACGCSTE